ncbi:hypothetical protein COU76_05225 [Candidatus Peregrinibacteria bacterium CG10_big_fil_rev_8_21_14_0_10_49_10]|nr:MAG: hypothetical protein COU76_05225 [Candidatus Peregrinibacteria bacterium CG10_big_fil_rev_8_21_14_0_10_49_10]
MTLRLPHRSAGLLQGLCIALLPAAAHAQGTQEVLEGDNSITAAISFIAFVVLSLVFSRLWLHILQAVFRHPEEADGEEPQAPLSPKQVLGILLGTYGLFFLALNNLEEAFPLEGRMGALTLGLLFVIAGGAALAAEQRFRTAKQYVFAAMIGTALSILLLGLQQSLFTGHLTSNPYLMSLFVLTAVLAWRCLFGPWNAHIKATVLGTFLLWIGVYLTVNDAPDIRMARILAGVVALIPAVIWCSFFLKYHAQRMSVVCLMFFAGMLSTAPILFYDKLVRSGAELQFFFFRIVPENFNRTSSIFVSGNLSGITGVKSTLLITLLSFLFVGVVEECSKFWVMKKSGTQFFSSIDDVMQLSIIVAIGFAFAENIINPTYFTSFVQDFLIRNDPQWGGFLGNVMGRAILTNMVHIVSTGVLGYFFGLALFAGPYIREVRRKGKVLWLTEGIHTLLRYPAKLIFRRQMVCVGLLLAVFLHGLFNFLVTFPDILPSHPATLADLFGQSHGSLLSFVPLLMIPSLFYVVGGFWLLTDLFYKKENMKERGHLVTTDTFVNEQVTA